MKDRWRSRSICACVLLIALATRAITPDVYDLASPAILERLAVADADADGHAAIDAPPVARDIVGLGPSTLGAWSDLYTHQIMNIMTALCQSLW
jgi:hypothetical protein